MKKLMQFGLFCTCVLLTACSSDESFKEDSGEVTDVGSCGSLYANIINIDNSKNYFVNSDKCGLLQEGMKISFKYDEDFNIKEFEYVDGDNSEN